MTFESMNSLEDVNLLLENNELVFLYVTMPNCSVCHGLEPQITLLFEKYPAIQARKVDASEVTEIAGKFNIFTAPVALLLVNGKEYIRKARFIPVAELDHDIKRIYENVVNS